MSDNKIVYSGKDYPVHSNGPWEADATHCRTAINSVATANSPRKHIAMVNLAKNPEYEITKEEHDANARLIAAAPEMLEALRWLDAENNRLNTLIHKASQKSAENFTEYIKEARMQVARECVDFVAGMAVFPYRQIVLGVSSAIKKHFKLED